MLISMGKVWNHIFGYFQITYPNSTPNKDFCVKHSPVGYHVYTLYHVKISRQNYYSNPSKFLYELVAFLMMLGVNQNTGYSAYYLFIYL